MPDTIKPGKTVRITSAETWLRWAETADAPMVRARHAREAMRIAVACRAARAPTVAALAAKIALDSAELVSHVASEFDREEARGIAAEAARVYASFGMITATQQ